MSVFLEAIQEISKEVELHVFATLKRFFSINVGWVTADTKRPTIQIRRKKRQFCASILKKTVLMDVKLNNTKLNSMGKWATENKKVFKMKEAISDVQPWSCIFDPCVIVTQIWLILSWTFWKSSPSGDKEWSQ